MSKKTYVRGFCKAAAAYGVDAKELYCFAIGRKFEKIAQEQTQEMDRQIAEAMQELNQYVKEHPITGRSLLGAASSIANGTAVGSSVGGSAGGLASAPVATVAAPIGGSVASSQGKPFNEGSLATSSAVEGAGLAGGGVIGAIPGSIAGSALALIGDLGGAVAGSTVDSPGKAPTEDGRRKQLEALVNSSDKELKGRRGGGSTANAPWSPKTWSNK